MPTANNDVVTVFDPKFALTGVNGEMYSVDGVFLANVNTWNLKVTVNNVDYQPAGLMVEGVVTTGYRLVLTFEELVIRDADYIYGLFLAIANKGQALSDFQLKYTSKEGGYGTIVVTNCSPEGDVDVLNVAPNEIIKRTWTWRVGAVPFFKGFIGSAAGTRLRGIISPYKDLQTFWGLPPAVNPNQPTEGYGHQPSFDARYSEL